MNNVALLDAIEKVREETAKLDEVMLHIKESHPSLLEKLQDVKLTDAIDDLQDAVTLLLGCKK
jgi:hypothetical protein